MSFLKALILPFELLGKLLFSSLSFCALVGAMVGVVAGNLLGLLIAETGVTLGTSEIVIVALILGFAGLLVVLIVIGVWLRYGVATIFWPALLNAVLTSLLTVWTGNALQMPSVTPLLGLLVGILVGTILCWLCGRYEWLRWGVAGG